LAEDIIEPIVEAMRARHASRIRAMDMSEYPLTMDVFLIASAETRIQARAVCDSVVDAARALGVRLHHREGYEEGSWILLDFGDLVVHVFLPQTREYYNLEMLWNDAPFKDFADDPGRPPDITG
jgi:ribosome-associated protein